MSDWPIYLAVWIGCGIIAALLGRSRQDAGNWFVIGLLAGPIGILMALMPPSEE